MYRVNQLYLYFFAFTFAPHISASEMLVTKDLCRLPLNREVAITTPVDKIVEKEIACMQKGFKHVWLGLGQKKDLEKLPKNLLQYVEQNTKQIIIVDPQNPFNGDPDVILYDKRTPAGIKNGLLLALLRMECYYIQALQDIKNAFLIAADKPEPYQLINPNNHYATAHLLGYSDEDIIFFYQRLYFLTENNLLNNPSYVKKPFIEWSPKQKELFQYFIAKETSQTEFTKDQVATEEWIKARQSFLLNQDPTYSIILNMQKVDQVSGTSIIQTPTIAQKQTMPVWKKVAIGTGLAGLSASALYLYTKYMQPSTPLSIK